MPPPVGLDHTQPGKPTDNGLIESFNGRLTAITSAKLHLEQRRRQADTARGHS
ncbi:integrase core domain-containing protein [Hydrogenophaga intermedia]|uniref:integrase core domain-containing protein n=1 Tax=Hydrogenophaga TaxID=47420 RepID=UPI0027F6D278|nr:transposase [Hydrogenophaga sp.]